MSTNLRFRRRLAGISLAILIAIAAALTITQLASSKAPASQPQSRSAALLRPGHLLKTYSGTSNRAIGSLNDKQALILQWKTAGHSIQIFTSHGFLLVASHDRTGAVRITRGDYSGLRVASDGAWTLRVSKAR